MSMRKHADLMASIGEFVDTDGRKAKRWIKCGVMMRDDRTGSQSLKLDVVPVGPTWSGWFAIRNISQDPDGDPECTTAGANGEA